MQVLIVYCWWEQWLQLFFRFILEKENEEEEKIKIGEVGYYTLAFRKPDDKYEEVYNGDKIVVEINNETDYEFQPGKQTEYYFHFLLNFLHPNRKVQT